MIKFNTMVAFSLLFNSAIYAETKILSKTIKEASNICDQNSDYFKKTGEECAVKKVRFETKNYSIQDADDPQPYYGTLGYFGFETKNWSAIQNYGFVQRIRGCTYETKKNTDGSISKRIGETIMHLGKKRILVFPEWSIDATTTDPLYYGPSEEDSHLPGGRLALYRWTPKLGVIESKNTKDLYQILGLPEAKRKVLSPSVFVSDSPSMAYAKNLESEEDKVFQNVSLEFEICLYNLNEIPLAITTDAPMTGTPLTCFKWDSQFEYNFDIAKFENKPNKGLDPFCASQEPLDPREVFKKEITE